MKAALEAWGSNSNLFHQGFAQEVADPKVIAATLAKPGVTLKRPVGSNEPFREEAHLPTSEQLSGPRPREKPAARKKGKSAPAKPARSKIDDRAARKAALTYEKEQRQRDKLRRREEAKLTKQRERRRRAIDAADAVLDAAKAQHLKKAAAIEKDRAALEARAEAEEARWEKEKTRLEAARRRAAR